MKEYKVLTPVCIICGDIKLSDRQANTRSYAIKAKGKSVYEILQPITLKAGEMIGLPMANKSLLPNLEEVKAKK